MSRVDSVEQWKRAKALVETENVAKIEILAKRHTSFGGFIECFTCEKQPERKEIVVWVFHEIGVDALGPRAQMLADVTHPLDADGCHVRVIWLTETECFVARPLNKSAVFV
jgi:hypothetical protein